MDEIKGKIDNVKNRWKRAQGDIPDDLAKKSLNSLENLSKFEGRYKEIDQKIHELKSFLLEVEKIPIEVEISRTQVTNEVNQIQRMLVSYPNQIETVTIKDYPRIGPLVNSIYEGPEAEIVRVRKDIETVIMNLNTKMREGLYSILENDGTISEKLIEDVKNLEREVTEVLGK